MRGLTLHVQRIYASQSNSLCDFDVSFDHCSVGLPIGHQGQQNPGASQTRRKDFRATVEEQILERIRTQREDWNLLVDRWVGQRRSAYRRGVRKGSRRGQFLQAWIQQQQFGGSSSGDCEWRSQRKWQRQQRQRHRQRTRWRQCVGERRKRDDNGQRRRRGNRPAEVGARWAVRSTTDDDLGDIWRSQLKAHMPQSMSFDWSIRKSRLFKRVLPLYLDFSSSVTLTCFLRCFYT